MSLWSSSHKVTRLSGCDELLMKIILNQGGVCYPSKLCVRLVAAAWCVGAFFIVNSYSTTLISHITASIEKPLINSVYDLPKKPEILVAVEEGRGPDGVFAGAQNGILKYISNTLNREPSSRCRRTEQCFEKVAQGTYVFVQVNGFT